MESSRTSPIITAFLLTSVLLAAVLLFGVVTSGAQIVYVGGTVGAMSGALLAFGYLIANRDTGKRKAIGILSLFANAGVFAWLFAAWMQWI